MTRLLVLHGSNDLYGASRVLLDDVRLLSELGHGVRVVLPGEGPLSPLLTAAGAEVLVRPLRVLRRVRRVSVLEWPLRLPVHVARDEQVVLWTLALLPYLPRLRIGGRPVLLSVHELIAGPAGALLARAAGLSGGPVMANSVATGRWLTANGVDPARVRIAYPAVAAQAPLSQPAGGRFRILVAARVSGGKGHRQAVAAVEALRLHGVEAELTLAGAPFPGQERHLRDLLGRVRRLPWARYVGEVCDLRALLADHHVLLVASVLTESFGLVHLEAWSAGRRSVGPDAGGAAEAVRMVEGITYPFADVVGMARALALVAREPRLREPPSPYAPVHHLCTPERRRRVWQETLGACP